MSQITIFGASGPTGLLLTSQALAEGYHVRAITRRPEAFPQRHARLEVLRADIHDPASIEPTLIGRDAVLSVLGVPYSFKPISTYSQGAAQLVKAMSAVGLRRLICVTSGGTSPGYDPTEGFFFGRIIKPTIGRTTYEDMRRMEAIVMASDLDWTIVRPGMLFKKPAVSSYRTAEGFFLPKGWRTARVDLADCMLKQLDSDQYLRKGVAIATF